MNDTTTDPAAELEARVLAGDDVTEAEAVAAYTEAEGRRWFEGLRQRRAERLAAEETERDHTRRRAAAVDQARTALASVGPERVAEAYDQAVAGIAALVDAVSDRETVLRELVDAVDPDRIPDAALSHGGRPQVRLDGQGWGLLDLHPLLEAACRKGGAVIGLHDGRYTAANRHEREYVAGHNLDPAVVKAGRPDLPPAAA